MIFFSNILYILMIIVILILIIIKYNNSVETFVTGDSENSFIF